MGERKKYTREFKTEALRLLNTSGKSGHEIEADLGIGTGMIHALLMACVHRKPPAGLIFHSDPGDPDGETNLPFFYFSGLLSF